MGEFRECLTDNWPIVLGCAVVILGMAGGIKPALAKLRGLLPGATGGKTSEHEAVDAVNLLCAYLPREASEKVCQIVAPHLFRHGDDTKDAT